MGFFKSSKSHLEVLEKDCLDIVKHAQEVRSLCDRSLRGKYENMMPEQRAGILKEANVIAGKLRATLDSARERERLMTDDQCPSEDLLTAHARVLDAALDVSRADQSIEEARQSLLAGMAEIEQFYGPRSKEARHVRRVLDELQSGP